jgi:GDP/UDP-N,N'-diacetylbacillosamine 2-epimerase (hydrolysing)
MSIEKILAFTAIRSDYDLMSGLYKKIHADPELELALIVSGAHLSESYGSTVKYIERDGLPIVARIESLIDSNSISSRIKSASILLQDCIHTVEFFKPDLILFAGDREDAIVAALISAYLKVPSVHFFGGDHASDGNVDNSVRHACSKLASFHFVTHERHVMRLKAIGEPDTRISLIGSPSLDKFINEPWITKDELLRKFGRDSQLDYAIMIHHPILGYEEKAGEYFEEILIALKDEGINAFVSYPNTDAGNKRCIAVIGQYEADPNFFFFKNLERNLFVNLMRHARFMIGNSSAGLFESPMIPLGVVNVGERQRGRIAAENVVFVDQGVENIRSGIRQVCSEGFRNHVKKIKSPYGEGNSVEKALEMLKNIDLVKYRYKSEDPLI